VGVVPEGSGGLEEGDDDDGRRWVGQTADRFLFSMAVWWAASSEGPVTTNADGALFGGLAAERLHAIALASVANAVVIADVAGTIEWVNPAFTTLSGYELAEAVGQTPRLLKSGLQGEEFYRQLWSTVLAGQVWRGEVVNRHRDGHLYTVLQTITPIVDEGALMGFVAIHEDITQLRSSQARLQALFDNALDAIVLFDGEGRSVAFNPAAGVLTGYSAGELAELSLVDVVPPEALAGFAQTWTQLFTDGQVRGELPILRRDGHERVIEFQAVTHIVPDVHLLIGRDVTDQRMAASGYRFQAQLLDAVGEAVIATDLDGTVRYWNPAAERMYGWPATQVLNRPIMELNVPGEAAVQAEQIMSEVAVGRTWTGEFVVQRRDGTHFPALVTDAPYLDAAGELAGIIGISTDITDLKHAQALLARHARQQEVIADLARQAITSDDPGQLGIEAQRAMAAALGGLSSWVEVVWTDGNQPTPAVRPEDELSVPIGTVGTLVFHTEDGTVPADGDHQFLQAVAHLLHVTVNRAQARSQLEHLATYDLVTGLPNRTLLLDRLAVASATSRRTGVPYAVLFLDLDGFKFINDGLGHETGDRILRLVADRLSSAVRPADTVARMGGDEYAIVCPDIGDVATARVVAHRLQTALIPAFEAERDDLAVTASIGIVVGDHTSDGPTLLRHADTAMYHAKTAGRNRIEVFNDTMQVQTMHRLDTAAHLRRALQDDGIVVLYQPVVSLATGAIVGVEALARLRLPSGHMLSPDQFIPVAEHTGLIVPLGNYVIERACRDAADWISAQPDFTVAVNISPRQFADPTTRSIIRDILIETHMPAERLMLELTESMTLNEAPIHACMQQLRQDGIKFAIDDFGTGYSSLAYLRDMPVTMLKIDRSFVGGLTHNPRDKALVAASIDLARQFSLDTTAEGVETPEQHRTLSSLGCTLAQGYLWSPPVDADAITAMLAQQPDPSDPAFRPTDAHPARSPIIGRSPKAAAHAGA